MARSAAGRGLGDLGSACGAWGSPARVRARAPRGRTKTQAPDPPGRGPTYRCRARARGRRRPQRSPASCLSARPGLGAPPGHLRGQRTQGALPAPPAQPRRGPRRSRHPGPLTRSKQPGQHRASRHGPDPGRTDSETGGRRDARTHARRTGPGGAAARAAPPPAGSRAAPAAAPPADPEVPLRRRRRLVRKPGAPRRPPRVRARGPQGAVPRARPGRAAGRAWRPGPVVRSGAGPGGPSPRPVPRPGVLAASLHGAGRPRSPTQSGGTRRAGGPRSRPASCYSNMWLRRAPSGQSSVLSSLRRSVPASLQAECGGHGAALPAR